MELENALNAALTAACEFDEKCSHLERRRRGSSQSERLTDSGVMLRGPGVARCPAEV